MQEAEVLFCEARPTVVDPIGLREAEDLAVSMKNVFFIGLDHSFEGRAVGRMKVPRKIAGRRGRRKFLDEEVKDLRTSVRGSKAKAGIRSRLKDAGVLGL